MTKSPLPERTIFLDGTKYFIHGLVHGNPWVKINSSFKKRVSQELEREIVLCEDGFISWIPHATSMKESEYFGFGKMSFLKRICFLGNFFYDYVTSNSEREDSEIFEQIRKMNSLEDLTKIRNLLFEDYPDEPEGINTLMRNKNSGTIENPKGNIPLIVRRYIYEAKTSINYAKKRNLGELHIVVGCAHELPLEYLLKNKEILERYSL